MEKTSRHMLTHTEEGTLLTTNEGTLPKLDPSKDLECKQKYLLHDYKILGLGAKDYSSY
jgi:hypothetical protein